MKDKRNPLCGSILIYKNKNTMTLYPKLITDALEKVIYPGTKKNIIESEMLADTPMYQWQQSKLYAYLPS